MNRKLTLVVLASIAAVTLIAIAAILLYALPPHGSMRFEIVKLLGQFFLVGVLGVVISLLVQDYNRQRDKEMLINDLRKTVLRDLIRAYSDTKKARRILMGQRLAGGTIPFAVYDQEMRNVIDTQLALEILNHQIMTSQKYFGPNVKKTIIDEVEAMEKYLGSIIDEYKDSLTSYAETPDTVTLEKLPELASSMGKSNESVGFRARFADPYRSAVAEIRKQILD